MLAIVVLVFLDRLMLKLEARGWIYYRKKKASPGSLGNAFMEIQSLIEPAQKHVLEIRRQQRKEQDGGAAPKVPALS